MYLELLEAVYSPLSPWVLCCEAWGVWVCSPCSKLFSTFSTLNYLVSHHSWISLKIFSLSISVLNCPPCRWSGCRMRWQASTSLCWCLSFPQRSWRWHSLRRPEGGSRRSPCGFCRPRWTPQDPVEAEDDLARGIIHTGHSPHQFSYICFAIFCLLRA